MKHCSEGFGIYIYYPHTHTYVKICIIFCNSYNKVYNKKYLHWKYLLFDGVLKFCNWKEILGKFNLGDEKYAIAFRKVKRKNTA